MLSLFEQYPGLQPRLPRISLTDLPTPVYRMKNLGGEIGLEHLYIKCDDRSAMLYGGNKVRKLEFLLGQALHNGAGSVLTFGCAGSNHALATAVYAKQLGLKCLSMLLPQPNAHAVRRNLLAGFQHGAELHHYENEQVLKKDTEKMILFHESAFGHAPELIPPGGSSPLGVIGYVNAGFEIKKQILTEQIPEPDVIYIASGTMGTSTGLRLGLKAAGLKTNVIPVRVAPEKFSNEKKMSDLLAKTASMLHSLDPSFSQCELPEEDTGLRHDFYGTEYARFTEEGMKAVRLIKKTEDVYLEGTYTGKTLAALLSDAQKGLLKNKIVLFWNTYNSRDLPDIPAGFDYKKLPAGFHRYFEEDVQELDREF